MATQDKSASVIAIRRLMWRWAVVLAALGVFAVWATWRMSTAAQRLPQLTAGTPAMSPAKPEVEFWTCTMHPEIRESQAGDCPICGMDLVAKYVGSAEPGVAPAARPAAEAKAWYRCTMPECGDVGSDDPNSRCPVCGMKRESVGVELDGPTGDDEIGLSERAQRLAALATEPVERRLLSKHIRAVGKIGYDETRHKMVSAWISGRIDQLFADFTGMVVSQGDHLVKIYSPELLSAQEEYLQARRALAATGGNGLGPSRRGAEQLAQSARRKLELLGITDVQIEAIESSGTPQTHLVVHAPLGGTIVGKRAMEGMYVKTGDPLYEIADLTRVWLLLDVYEADLLWVQPFQEVRVTAEALPGEQFRGQLAFVDPVVDETTRTIRVRVNIDNPKRRLKPEMFVTAEVVALMRADGRAAVSAPAGSHACPMHTWETADSAAACPICEMAMVPVETIPGYVPAGEPDPLLSVPREAILKTGERCLAYVEVQPGTYRGVEVVVGPLAQDERGQEFYPILAGLEEGQQVVTRGNFAVDSQMQLAGKPSLFSPGGGFGGSPAEHAGHGATQSVDSIEQTVCPVMGNPIDKDSFIDYRGVRVYFCCPGCDAKFLADPMKYIPNLPKSLRQRIGRAELAAAGAATEQKLCPVMGNPINREVFIVHKGVKVYFCCPGCDGKFKADPQKYIPKLPPGVQAAIRQAEKTEGER